MQQFANSVDASLRSQNWLAALFMALALPDICGALEDPDRGVGERYKAWFERYLREAYDPRNMHEALAATEPERLARMPDAVVEFLKTKHFPPGTAFTAADCYRLRCRCLHQGLAERMGDDRVHFTVPDPSGQLKVHKSSVNGVLQLSVDVFCRDVAQAVARWWQDVQARPDVLARASELIKIYGLDAVELPIVRYSRPGQ